MDVERVIEGLAVEERVIVGADLNGHIGTLDEGVKRINGGFGFGLAKMQKDEWCWTWLCRLILQLQTHSYSR